VRRFAALLLLLVAAAAPPKGKPAPTPASPPAKAEDVAEQLAMLAFDANPLWSIPARVSLSRWVGPMRLFVFGRKEDRDDARAATRALRPSGIAMRIVAEHEVSRAQPNAFVVVDEHLPEAFQGPLRGMLRNAFLGDEAAIDGFILGVVMVTPCWTLPVWTDETRLVLKAALIGVDASLPRERSRACILRGLGAALGLLGPGAFLPGSAFAPGTAAKLTRDDDRMLRTLYGRGLHPGMNRDEAHAAAVKALAAPPRRKKPAPKP
jgi:hypothetical protein